MKENLTWQVVRLANFTRLKWSPTFAVLHYTKARTVMWTVRIAAIDEYTNMKLSDKLIIEVLMDQ